MDVIEAGARPSSLRANFRRLLFASVTCGAVLAIGSLHTEVLCVVVALLAIAFAIEWGAAGPLEVRSSAIVVAVVGVILTGYTAIQAIPMPIAWLRAIAPYNADVWSRALAPFGEHGPAWAPISLDPVATRLEVLKGVAYLLAFGTAVRIAARRGGVAFLAAAVITTGAIVAIAALLHPALGAHKVFGIYEPKAAIAPRHIAPLLNPNHLGGFLNLAFCLSLAGALSREPRIPRSLLVVVAILLSGTELWAASRGGVAAMLIATVAVYWLTVAARPVMSRGRWTTILPLVLIFLGAAVLVVAGAIDSWFELYSTDVSKVGLQRFVVRMVASVPWFGVGRGAFASSFAHFRNGGGYTVSTHPENFVGQWFSEWGIPVSVFAFLLLGFALRPRNTRQRASIASGAGVAILALALQNLVDFSSEVPGVMLSATVCVAIVVGGPRSRGAADGRTFTFAFRPVVPVLAAASASCVAIVVAIRGAPHELAKDREHLFHFAAADAPSREAVYSTAREAVLRHPAEPYLPLAVAFWESRQRSPRVMAWAGAVIDRAPVYAPVHLVLARALRNQSPSQARLEYRTALEQAPELPGSVMDEAVQLVSRFQDALDLLPIDSRRRATASSLAARLRGRLPSTSSRLSALAHDGAPAEPLELDRDADAIQSLDEDLAVAPASPWCMSDLAACRQSALDAASRLHQRAPADLRAALLYASVRTHAGDAIGALDWLLEACDGIEGRSACFRTAVNLALQARMNDDPHLSLALDKLARAPCGSPAECVAMHWFVGDVESSRGRLSPAVAAYKQAIATDPERTDLVERLAAILAASPFQMHGEALSLYRRLAARDPAKWQAAVDRETVTLMREATHLQ